MIKQILVRIGTVGAVVGSALVALPTYAQSTLFPAASVSEIFTSFLTDMVSLLVSQWPIVLGVVASIIILLFLIRKARKSLGGGV